jgi:shikimate dehydrogenase/3-dehydroquinate dehydratase type I
MHQRATVICSILEHDAQTTSRRVARAPAGCELVEIRGDHLGEHEIAGLVRQAGRPVVATVRRSKDGGHFKGDDEKRGRILRGALQAGARFIDVEHDGPLRHLAEGELADRIILSHHGASCRSEELESLYREMAATPAALLKIVPSVRSVGEVAAVRELLALAASEGRSLACFAAGRAGAITRLLAPAWGSWASYGSPTHGSATAAGQFLAAEMLGVYDVLGLGSSTRRFALVGREVFGSPSPAMHRAAARNAGLDARYFPIEVDDLDELRPCLGPGGTLGVEALAVTMPFKEPAFRCCRTCDDVARASGSVNTVLLEPQGWVGYNTDGPAMLQLVREQLDPAGARVAIIGAGGTARTAAVVLRAAGADVRLFNRGEERGRQVAAVLGVLAGPWDELAGYRWDVLVQATPLGGRGEVVVPAEHLNDGVVLDVVYGTRTPLVRDAARRGLRVIDGLDLLVAQAVLQFERLTGSSTDARVMRQAGQAWLAARGRPDATP